MTSFCHLPILSIDGRPTVAARQRFFAM